MFACDSTTPDNDTACDYATGNNTTCDHASGDDTACGDTTAAAAGHRWQFEWSTLG